MSFQYRFLLIAIVSNLFFRIDAQFNTPDSLYTALQKANTIKEKINTNIEIAAFYQEIDIDSVHKYIYKAVGDSKKVHDTILQIKGYLILIGSYTIYVNSVDTNAIYNYFDSVEYLSNSINYQPGIARVYYFKGLDNLRKNKFEESANYLITALEKYTELNDEEHIAQTNHLISYYYLFTNDYKRALEYGQESNKTFKKLHLYENQMAALNNLGIIYNKLKDTVNTIDCWKECYQLSMKYGQPDDQQRGLNLIANQFTLNKQIDSAIYYYKKVIDLDVTSPELRLNKAYSYINLAMIYYKQDDLDKAEEYLLTASDLAIKYNSTELKLICLRNLPNLYEKMSDYQNALKYLSDYNKLTDSIKLDQASLFLDKIMSDNELKDKIDELNTLKVQQASMVKKAVLFSIFALFLIITFYAFQYYQRYLFYKNKKAIYKNSPEYQSRKIWYFSFPRKQVRKWKLLISTALIISALYSFHLFAFPGLKSGICLIVSSFIVGVLYYLTYMGMSYIQNRLSNLTLRNEAFQSLIINIGFILLTSTLFLAMCRLDFNLKNLFYSSMIISIANFSVLLILGILTFRDNYDYMFEELFDEINEKHLARLEKLPAKEEETEKNPPIIQVDGTAINLDEVLYISSENVYQEYFYWHNNKINSKLIRSTLSTIEKELDTYPNFIRCQRSYIINLNKVKEFKGNSKRQYAVIESTNEKITVSPNLSTKILSRFEEINFS